MHSNEIAKKIIEKIKLDNYNHIKGILDVIEQKFLDELDEQIEFEVDEFNKILRNNQFATGYGPALKLVEQIGGYFCTTGSRPDPHRGYEGSDAVIDYIIIRIPNAVVSETKLNVAISCKVK